MYSTFKEHNCPNHLDLENHNNDNKKQSESWAEEVNKCNENENENENENKNEKILYTPLKTSISTLTSEENMIDINISKNIIKIKGNKVYYGLLIGKNGKTFNQIVKGRDIKIIIPNKNNNDNLITIEGNDRHILDACNDIIYILYSHLPKPMEKRLEAQKSINE